MRQTLAGGCAGGVAEGSVGPLETGFGRDSRRQRDSVETVEWGGGGPSTRGRPRLGGGCVAMQGRPADTGSGLD